jgi:hypothetical protein
VNHNVTILPLPLLANVLSSPHPPSIPRQHSSPICDHNVPQVPALTFHTSHLEVLKLSSCTLTYYKPQIYSHSSSSSRAAPKPALAASPVARMSPTIQHAGRCHASAERCVGTTPAPSRSGAQIAMTTVAHLHSLTKQHRPQLHTLQWLPLCICAAREPAKSHLRHMDEI